MVKVITYGTYDLLHYGHIRLLERAKALGDYLIVGVTADDFDKNRGKINVQQTLMERVEAVRETGIADEIIIEEYEGQKIDDIRRYDIDIFTVGSDWTGKFDYLKEYCRVVYLERTEGVSSSEIRTQKQAIRLGLVGEPNTLKKYNLESNYVNGAEISGVCTKNTLLGQSMRENGISVTDDYTRILSESDAVYVASHPTKHYEQVRNALLQGKHVLCESPVSIRRSECKELFQLAQKKNLILMEAIKTAYSTAYNRLHLLVKSGKIGRVVSVDTTCTSLHEMNTLDQAEYQKGWNSICYWGPVAMLPIFQILGTEYKEKNIVTCISDEKMKFDSFTKIDFTYANAVASMKIGKGVKSEGEMVISGTKGYIYVPAPWWKMDYFEVRYENQEDNSRYFYQLDGEGIRYELVTFIKSIEKKKNLSYIKNEISETISDVMEDFYNDRITKIQM